jgi:epoxyqueuosine reductase
VRPLGQPETGARPARGSPAELARTIESSALAIGFDAVGFASASLGPDDEQRLAGWLEAGWHGEMAYMAEHGARRARPAELIPGTVSVVCVALRYGTRGVAPAPGVLASPDLGYIARYALGRDYHKVIRPRLARLAERVAAAAGPFGYRAFVDSAPVLEKPLARDAGLGWIGKHTLLLHEREGSTFLLGELYTDLPLPAATKVPDRCGTCDACLAACPTGAIVGPYRLDARRCISYLTIELRGPIPPELRPLVGNRVFGCDDCQLACPWNRFARLARQPDFAPRHSLDAPRLVDLFAWSEAEYLAKTEGMALRRVGYEGWLRNVAVALGNATSSPEVVAALRARADHPSPLVRDHVSWALARHVAGAAG